MTKIDFIPDLCRFTPFYSVYRLLYRYIPFTGFYIVLYRFMPTVLLSRPQRGTIKSLSEHFYANIQLFSTVT